MNSRQGSLVFEMAVHFTRYKSEDKLGYTTATVTRDIQCQKDDGTMSDLSLGSLTWLNEVAASGAPVALNAQPVRIPLSDFSSKFFRRVEMEVAVDCSALPEEAVFMTLLSVLDKNDLDLDISS